MIKQNDGRYSRDIVYGNDTQNLGFYDKLEELTDIEQIQDTFGNYSNYLDYGLNWILETHKRFGFEGKIEYIIQKDGLRFSTGLLDMANPETDEVTYYKCNIIQNTQIADYKRHEGTNINVFSDKNVKNESITPVETFKFLRKAVPIFKTSSFDCQEVLNFITYTGAWTPDDGVTFNPLYQFVYYNAANNIVLKGIPNTISFSQKNIIYDSEVEDFNTPPNSQAKDFTILQAVKKLKNVELIFENFNIDLSLVGSDPHNCYSELTAIWGYDIDTPIDKMVLLSFWDDDTVKSLPDGSRFIIPEIPTGAKLWLYMKSRTKGSETIVQTTFTMYKYDLTINAYETSLNTVVLGVRYIDMMRQCSKFINNLPIQSFDFDYLGNFYNQVCWSRALVSYDTNKPFVTTLTDILGSVQEVNRDYEIQKDKIFIGSYAKFYENKEVGVFEILPSKDFKANWNERFKINIFSFAYKTFEQNRLSENTVNDIHTDSEWIVPTSRVENKKEVSLDLIRSGFSQQIAVDLETTKPKTATETDDKVYITDIIELPDYSFETVSAILTMRVIDGKLEILNVNSTTAESDIIINWNVLGFEVGSTFEILEGNNIGNYIVDSITQTNLVLRPSLFVPAFTGDSFIKFKFYYSGIHWQTRTNEGLTVLNLKGGENYPNLKYSIRQNMKYWESFINTACHFSQDKAVLNSYFKNNPTASINGVVENDTIEVSSLAPQLLTPKIYDINVTASYTEVLTLLNTLKTNRGFIRCYNINGKVIKGYIKDLDYTWKSEDLTLTIEEKFESERLILKFVDGVTVVDHITKDGVLNVNDVLYNLSGVSDWWKITDEYLQIFDNNNIPICNITRFDLVTLNEFSFDTVEDLYNALSSL